jgi:hypothetical protein
MCVNCYQHGDNAKLQVYKNLIFVSLRSICTNNLKIEREWLWGTLIKKIENTWTPSRSAEVQIKLSHLTCIIKTFAVVFVPLLFLAKCGLKMIRRHFVCQGQLHRNINASCYLRPATSINAANWACAFSITNHVRSTLWFSWIHSFLLCSFSHHYFLLSRLCRVFKLYTWKKPCFLGI